MSIELPATRNDESPEDIPSGLRRTGRSPRQLLKYRYFQDPYVVEFTVSPDEPLTYTDRIRARMPDSPGASRVMADFPFVPIGKYCDSAEYHEPW